MSAVNARGQFGPLLQDDGTTFRLWAPGAQRVDVVLDTPRTMTRENDGWYRLHCPGIGADTHYRFRIDGELDVPDPGSDFQPEDISGPSRIVDHGAYHWRAEGWRGRPWHDAVVIETHVGTFTPDGTYRAMIDRLDHLVETGITALELMPLADFPGRWNWGYDGVLWYAPDSTYGTPDDLKTLVDEAHLRGLMVLLDVVYNHFGPEGNYLGRYAPQFFSQAETPWGSAIDYSVPQVRAFAIENALHWLRDYRFDGLRLDAVHSIVEPGAAQMLRELSRAAGELAALTSRHIHLVLENDDNRAAVLDSSIDPPDGRYRAQWNDDYHHAWHALLTGEHHGYYADYADKPLQHVVRALSSGFAYQGEPSPHRDGQARGEPSGNLPPAAFVNFLQNHDQTGNRPLGERLDALASPAAVEAALAVLLLAPMPPMLFMGEEWGSRVPFLFFCDFGGDLADAVRNGRRREFRHAYEMYGEGIPDPLDAQTFRRAKLDWLTCQSRTGKARLGYVRELLAIRAEKIRPHLDELTFGSANAEDSGLVSASWTHRRGSDLLLYANLSNQPAMARPKLGHTMIWGNAKDAAKAASTVTPMAPWEVVWAFGPA